MQNYEETDLTQAVLEPLRQIIARHVQSGPVRAFLTGLLTLTVENRAEWHTRKQIGAVVGIEPERCTAYYWVTNKALLDQFDIYRNRLSEGLGGRLLALRLHEGSPQKYRLELVDAALETVPFRLAGSVIRYRLSDEGSRLSWLGKLHHPGVGTSRDHYRKWLFLTPFLVAVLSALLVTIAGGLITVGSLHGAQFRLFDYLAITGFGALLAFGIWTRWGRLFDDRVLLLGLNDLEGSTEGVVLDRERVEGKSFMVLRRYVAPCPICSATVRLASGTPDFKRRIVGRCEESPREHVYSFDRVTLEGGFLVQSLAANPS